MRLHYTSANGRMQFEFDGSTHKEVIQRLAAIQELFEEPACGCCNSKDIRFDVREFDGNSYYKLVCPACSAQLDFGQHKTGGSLFVKRTDKDKRPMPNRGWYIWNRNNDH